MVKISLSGGLVIRNSTLRAIVLSGLTAAIFPFATDATHAQTAIKVGAVLPMTGPQQANGTLIAAGIRLYMAQHGDTVAGKKVQVIVRDDGGVPDNSKRLAQEMIVNDKVNFLVGFGITPTAVAVTPLASEAKIP
jgi:branched-chain amino acid transport system substrate-binding protein